MNFNRQTLRSALLAGLVFSASSAFSQAVVLNPGDQIVTDGPTVVFCKRETTPFKAYCKCNEVGFSHTPTLQLMLDLEGNTDDLASYASLAQCEAALRTNPGCVK